MICAAIEDFATALPRAGAIAGLDLGTKTIGVAVSDGLRSVASPLLVIRREKFTLDAQALLKIVADRALVGIVDLMGVMWLIRRRKTAAPEVVEAER